MLRIPNPGSDIDIFVRIFRDLHAELKGGGDFNLDAMGKAMIERNNVSSQGAIGQEALRRSTRADRSRDPIYNQAKAYSELYRTLGWIQSTTSALNFTFSWLGEHAAETPDPNALVVECLLGIAYPNEALTVQGSQSVRVFPAILAAASALDGEITRDEMIIGPLSIADDRDQDLWSAMTDKLRRTRSSKNGMKAAIEALSAARGISHITMANYTRFPIAALQWAGWCEKSSRSSLRLTAKGRDALTRHATLNDFRINDYKTLPQEAKAPFVRLSAHLMLERAGFDISSVTETMRVDWQTLHELGACTNSNPWFSPFQQLTRPEANIAFPHLANCEAIVTQRQLPGSSIKFEPTTRFSENVRVRFEPTNTAPIRDSETESLTREIQSDLAVTSSKESAAELFAARHALDNQDVFYPLVAALFRLIGFRCKIARRGVNYDRADAMIVDDHDSIPIEIKSPGEETEISVKAIRQAVENKVVLLSRKQHATRRSTTTLAVGFNSPNERSEVRELIEDINRAYGFNVGVFDIRAVFILSASAILSDSKLALDGFVEMKGVANANDILSS